MSNETEEADPESVSRSASCGALEWRSEPPTEEGYYWHKLVSQNYAELPVIVYVHFEDGDMYVTEYKHAVHVDEYIPDHLFGHAEWAGPIPKPSEA